MTFIPMTAEEQQRLRRLLGEPWRSFEGKAVDLLTLTAEELAAIEKRNADWLMRWGHPKPYRPSSTEITRVLGAPDASFVGHALPIIGRN